MTIKKPQDTAVQSALAEISFFDDFPSDLLGKVEEMTEVISYEAGTDILRQGQFNSELYFLISGKVGVYVDGALIVHLESKGDVFGEMSVISKRSCAASIVAESDVEVYKVQAKKFQQFSGGDRDKFHHALYRIYSLILTERLETTNEKAKHFEALTDELQIAQERLQKLNSELERKVEERTADLKKKTEDLTRSHIELENQNAAILASHKKIEELYAVRDVTFEKLEVLCRDHLSQLRVSLEDLAEVHKNDGSRHQQIENTRREVLDVINHLEPITSRYKAEVALKSKRVLLAEASKKQQVTAKMALGGTGVDLEIVTSIEEGKGLIDCGEFDIVVVNSETLDLTRYATEKHERTKCVFMTSEPIPQYLPRLKQHPFFPNVVSIDVNDRTFTLKNIMTTIAKLTSEDIFGVEKYLGWGVDIQERQVMTSRDRQFLIEEMRQYFKQLGIRNSVSSRACVVSEELLMNAVYDAPRDSQGNPLYNHQQRTTEVNLQPSQYGRLRYGTDGMLLGISVADPFGGLSAWTVLDYLESCYGGRAGALNEADAKKAGAGRGIHMIVEHSDLVVFNVRPKFQTEVIGLFNVDPKQGGDKNPSFHFFTQN